MKLNYDVNPQMEVLLNKVKPDFIRVTMATSSVLTVGWQMI